MTALLTSCWTVALLVACSGCASSVQQLDVDSTGSCPPRESLPQVNIGAWPVERRASLARLADAGLSPAARYVGGRLTLLDACTIKARFAARPLRHAQEKTVSVEDATGLFRELPAGGESLLPSLAPQRPLILRTRIQRELHVTELDDGVLPASFSAPPCAEATHVVAAIGVGSFDALVSNSAGAWSALGTSSREVSPVEVTLAPLERAAPGHSPGGRVGCATEVRLLPPSSAEPWQLESQEGVRCQLPCSRWLMPAGLDHGFVISVRSPDRSVRLRSLPSSPRGHAPVTAQVRHVAASKGPAIGLGLALTAFGAAAVTTAIVVDGSPPSTGPESTSAIGGSLEALAGRAVLAVLGAAIGLGGVGLTVKTLAGPSTEPALVPVAPPKAAARPALRWTVGPGGVAGSF
ncbi:hypothetical protein WME89_47800 [Sorangium sp. So ce321]|uniref:hypothetical protein n=1 Tax=Sorangium sp. So ce321 TaxID=3133300 RepID=UPI003F648C47